jgi:amino acid transporter
MAIQTESIPQRNQTVRGRFGTFAGVFTPNVLTILGIILFLRTGWVVGQAGLISALVIVAIANTISVLTGLSLSAIATSMRVRTGGNYYIISRSLGLEIGGAIGIPLFLSQAISVAFYIIGFTEALVFVEIFRDFDPRIISTTVVLVFGAIAFTGADFALRIQFVILAALAAALISFFSGGWDSFLSPSLSPNYSPGVTFWTVFAIFFPAVTGITVGASMSGDLRDPGKSIPQGTMVSIVLTAAIYLAAVLWLGLHATPDQLITDNLIMQQIARWPALILVGVWASTLSSALGSILAAPRVLQALSYDQVVPRWLGTQLGSATEPRTAVLLTTAIALGVIWMGDLDFVAPIITMFFLNTYGMTNLVAGIEQMVGNPSFRPRFKVHWSLSLLGGLGCYGTMFLINSWATVFAIVFSYGIYFVLKERTLERTWGDVRSGIWFTLARFALLNLEGQRYHFKNWRPNLLVFTGQPHNRERLVEVAEWLSRGGGIVTFFQLLVGDIDTLAGHGIRKTARRHIREYIQNRNMTAFAEAEVVDDFFRGALTVAQAHGIGGLEPNAVLLGWSGTHEGRILQTRLLRELNLLSKSVLLLNYDEERKFGRRQAIDVWWGGRAGNADLMLLLAHIITRDPSWEGARIRLLRVIGSEEGRDQATSHLQELLNEVRVEAEPVIIIRESSAQRLTELIARHSTATDLTLLGTKLPELADLDDYVQRLNELVESAGSVLLVRSAHQEEDLLTAE